MNRIVYLLPLVVVLALGSLLFVGVGRDQTDETALADREYPALPVASYEDLSDAKAEDLLASGDLVLVNFFASWCPPCRAEHPNLTKLKESGVEIIGVNYKDIEENMRTFIAEEGNPFASIVIDDTGRTGIDWGVAAVPETFFIKDGKILHRHKGPIVGDGYEDVVAKIAEYSAE